MYGAFGRFSVIFVGRFGLELVSKFVLLIFYRVRRVFVPAVSPAVSLQLSTAGCSLPTFRAYRRTMAFPYHVEAFHRLVFTSPYELGDDIDASRVVSLRFRESFDLPICCCWTFLAPWRVLPFAVGLPLLLGMLIFPTQKSSLLHPKISVPPLKGGAFPSYCYRDACALTLSTIGFTLRAPFRSHVSGPVLVETIAK